jgi:hypothetical protein
MNRPADYRLPNADRWWVEGAANAVMSDDDIL